MNYKNDLLVTKSINRKEGMDGKAKNTVLYLAIATVIMIIMLISPGFNNEVYAATVKQGKNYPGLKSSDSLFTSGLKNKVNRNKYYNELKEVKAVEEYIYKQYKDIMGELNYRPINLYAPAIQGKNTFTTLTSLGLGDPSVNEMLNLASDQLIKIGGAAEPVMGKINPKTGQKDYPNKNVGEISKLAAQGKLVNVLANEKLQKGKAENKLGYTIWDASNDVGVFCSEEGAPYGGFGFQEGKNSNGDLTATNDGRKRNTPLTLEKIYKDQINDTVGGGTPEPAEDIPILATMINLVKSLASNQGASGIIQYFLGVFNDFISKGTNKDVYVKKHSNDIQDKILKTLLQSDQNAARGNNLTPQKHQINYSEPNKDIVVPTGNKALPSEAGSDKIYPIIGDLGYAPNAITLLDGLNHTVNTSAYFPKNVNSDVDTPYEYKDDVFKPTNGAAANGQVYVTPSILTNKVPGVGQSDLLKIVNGQYTNPKVLENYLTPRVAFAVSSFLEREYGWEQARKLKKLFGEASDNLSSLLDFSFKRLRDLENRYGKQGGPLYNKIKNSDFYKDLTSIFTGAHRGKNSIQTALWNMKEIAQNRKTPPRPGNLFTKANIFSDYYKDILEFEKKHKDYKKPDNVEEIFADGYHADMKVHQNENMSEYDSSQGSVAPTPSKEKSIIIKNPKIKYEPKVLPGDGMKIEDAKKIKFDKNTQKWTIGPFKLDYLRSGIEGDKAFGGNEDVKGKNAEYFTTLTGIKLKGKYVNETASVSKLAEEVVNRVGDIPNSIGIKSSIDGVLNNDKSLQKLTTNPEDKKLTNNSNLEKGENTRKDHKDEIVQISSNIKNTIMSKYNISALSSSGYDPKDPILIKLFGSMLKVKDNNGKEYLINIKDFFKKNTGTRDIRRQALIKRLGYSWRLDYERLINEFWGTINSNNENLIKLKPVNSQSMNNVLIKLSEFDANKNWENLINTSNKSLYDKTIKGISDFENIYRAIYFSFMAKFWGDVSLGILDLRGDTLNSVQNKFNLDNFYRQALKDENNEKEYNLIDTMRDAIAVQNFSGMMLGDLENGKLFAEKIPELEAAYTSYNNPENKDQKDKIKKDMIDILEKYFEDGKSIDINYNDYFKTAFNLKTKVFDINGTKKKIDFDYINFFDEKLNLVINKDNFKNFIDPVNNPDWYFVNSPNRTQVRAVVGDKVNVDLILLLDDEKAKDVIKSLRFIGEALSADNSELSDFNKKLEANPDKIDDIIKKATEEKIATNDSVEEDYGYKQLIKKFSFSKDNTTIKNNMNKYLEYTRESSVEKNSKSMTRNDFANLLKEDAAGLVEDVTKQIMRALDIGIDSGVSSLVSIVKTAIPGGSVIPDDLMRQGFTTVVNEIKKAVNLKELVQDAVGSIIDKLPENVKVILKEIIGTISNLDLNNLTLETAGQTVGKQLGDITEKYLLNDKDGKFGEIISAIGGIIGDTSQLFKKQVNLDSISTFGTKLPNGAVGGVFDEYDKPKMEANPNKWYSTAQEAQGITARKKSDNVNRKDETESIKDIKAWRIKVRENKEGEGKVRLPKPNEQFIFEIDYDPALKSIEKARFEFAYMVYGGFLNKYQPYMNRIATTKVTKEISKDDQASVSRSIFPKSVFSTPISFIIHNDTTLPLRDVPGKNGRTDFNLNVEYSSDSQLQQKISNVIASRWIEEIGVELKFTPSSNDNGLNLMIPIGGKVWEDGRVNDKKNVGFDNVFGTGDTLKSGIRVTILRNFVRVTHVGNTKKVYELIKKEKARLFNKNGVLLNNDKIYTVDGRYGDFYIHDIGFTESELNRITGGDRKNLKNLNNYEIVYEVRFDYDGMMFEPVIPLVQPTRATIFAKNNVDMFKRNLVSYMNTKDGDKKDIFKNTSHAIENPKIREAYNKDNATITGATQLDSNGVTFGKVRDIKLENPKLVKYQSEPIKNEKVKDEKKDHSGDLQLEINTLTSKFQERLPKDFDGGVELNHNDPKVKFDKIFMSASTFNMGLQLPGNEKIVYDKNKLKIEDKNGIDQVKGMYYENKTFMKDINLGLKRRPQVDINLDHKLNNATVTINKKVYEYSLNNVETGMLTKEEKDKGVPLPIKYNGDLYGDIDGIKEKKDIQNPRKVRRYMDLYKMDYLYRTGMYNVQKPVYKKITGEIEDNKEIEKDPDKRIDPRQLDMFFTYKTIVTNNSPVDSVKINAIDNYYNNKMEIVDQQVVKIVQQDPEFNNSGDRQDNVEKPSSETGISLANSNLNIDTPSFRVNNWNSFAGSKDFDPTKYKLEVQRLEQDLNKKEFKAKRTLPKDDIDDKTKNIKHSGINAIRLKDLKDDKTPILLAPDETAEIFYTFRIKNAEDLDEVIINNAGETNVFASLETLVNNKEIVLPDAMNLGDFMTTAEIAAFTTYDPISGLPSGKFDEDSAPDNVRVEELQDNLKVKNFETDTSSAEIMHIRIKPEKELGNESRIVKGLLWEDKRTLNNNGVQTGDGIFNKDTENGIPHHPVTLEERITVQKKGVTNSGYEDIPFIWPEKINVTDKYNKKIKVNIKEATGFESNVMTGDDGNYEFKGVPVGNMVVTLDYSSPKAEEKLNVYNNELNRAIPDGAVRAIQNSNLTQEDLVRTVRDKLDKDGKQEAPREVQYYNGVDFKNTLFYEKEDKKVIKYKHYNRNAEKPINLDKTWITKDMANTQNLSFLRDDEYRRLEISTTFRNMNNELAKYVQLFRLNKDKWKNSAISNADLSLAHKLTSMHGSTPKINFNVENNEYNGVVKDENSSYLTGYTKVKKGVKTHVFPGIYNAKKEAKKKAEHNKYIVPNMNLGIVERPRPKQVLNKEITEIKVTTADGNTPINLKYNITTTFNKEKDKDIKEILYGESPIGKTNVYFSRQVDKENSTGIDTILELDRTNLPNGRRTKDDTTIKSGFKYINIDKKLLQNAVINVKYEIYGYNAGEVDRKIEVPNNEVYLKAITKILNSNVTPHLTKEQLTKELMANKGEKLDVIRKIAYREGFDMANGMLYHQSNINNFGYGIFSGLEYYVKLDGISKDKDIDINKTLEDEDTSEVKINKVFERVDNDYKLNLADKDNQGFIPAEDSDIVNMIQGIRNPEQLTSNTDSKKHADILDGNGVSYIKRDKDGTLTGTNLFFNKKYSEKLTPIHNLIKKQGNVIIKIPNINLDGDLKDSKKEIKKDSNNIKIDGKTYISKWTVKPSSILSTATSGTSMVFENIVEILETTSDTGVPPSDIPGSLQPDIDLANENGGGVIPGNNKNKVDINPYKDVEGSSPDRTVLVTADHDGSSTNEIVTLSPPTGLPIFEASKAATLKMTFAVIIVSLLTGLVAIKTEKRSNLNKK